MFRGNASFLAFQALALGATLTLPATAMAGGEPVLTGEQQQAVVQHRADRAKEMVKRRQQRHQVVMEHVDPATVTDEQRQQVQDLYRRRAERAQQIHGARQTLRQNVRVQPPQEVPQ